MEQFEKVEKLREKTGVSYEDAKKALEEHDWDMLEAIVALENEGKIKKPEVSTYTTGHSGNGEFENASRTYEENSSRMTFGQMADKFFQWCGKIIKKGCENFFEVKKNGKEIINIPVIVLVIFILVAFWVTVPLLIIGMFCGFKYSFRGDMAGTIDINSACDKAAQTCVNIKKEFTGKQE